MNAHFGSPWHTYSNAPAYDSSPTSIMSLHSTQGSDCSPYSTDSGTETVAHRTHGYFQHDEAKAIVRYDPANPFGSQGDDSDHHSTPRQRDETPATTTPLVSERDLDEAFAYCYRREDGRYTRLIPADTLPTLEGISAVESSSCGMVELPRLRGAPITRAHPIMELHTTESAIDDMVSTQPSTSIRDPQLFQQQQLETTGTNRFSHALQRTMQSQNQPQLYQPPAQSATQSRTVTQQPKRNKVYCDKWVHEGVCAFTQQGCKYKHEMPMDRATQQTLGLFHGLPSWWRKHQAEMSQTRDRRPEPRQALATSDPFDTAAGRGTAGLTSGGTGTTGVIGSERRPTGRTISTTVDHNPTSRVSPARYVPPGRQAAEDGAISRGGLLPENRSSRNLVGTGNATTIPVLAGALSQFTVQPNNPDVWGPYGLRSTTSSQGSTPTSTPGPIGPPRSTENLSVPNTQRSSRGSGLSRSRWSGPDHHQHQQPQSDREQGSRFR